MAVMITERRLVVYLFVFCTCFLLLAEGTIQYIQIALVLIMLY